ncbi:hypothetical protein EWI61_13500 [Methylolobus aquaticus]|nr:hypothetical protein EWI61_13500 [Methylolobus aquaticus]
MNALWHRRMFRSVCLKSGCLILVSALSLSTLVEASEYKVFHQFPKGYGFTPTTTGILVQGQDGNIYGTTPNGGRDDCGVAFSITPQGQYAEFAGFCDNPNAAFLAHPSGGLMLGSDGAFYGFSGGQYPAYLFKLKNSHLYVAGYFKDEETLSTGAPVEGVDGSLYGLATGFSNGYYDYVYGFTPGSGLYLVKKLGAAGHDAQSPLLIGWDGNQYGPTYYGAAQEGGVHGQGRLFSITIDGMYQQLNGLYDFTHKPTSGRLPNGPLIRGLDGNLYGTAQDGGSAERGVVFMLEPGNSARVKRIYSFKGTGDGSTPFSGMVLGSNGVFYGTTASGGDSKASCGTLFSLTPNSPAAPTAYTFAVEHVFQGGAANDGCNPKSPPMLHTNGRIYGLIAGQDQALIYSLDVGAPQTVTVLPQAAKIGQSVTILGQGLNSTTAVAFGGIAATSFKVVSRTLVKATVPAGAATGVVTVTTSRGTVSSPTSFPIVP